MHERSSRSAPSRLHQFCTSRQQLPPSTCHAGGQLSRRPLRWLAEEQSPLLNRLLRASAIGPDHLLASGTKDQAVGPLSQARSGTRSTIAFLRLDFGQKRDCPQGIFNWYRCPCCAATPRPRRPPRAHASSARPTRLRPARMPRAAHLDRLAPLVGSPPVSLESLAPLLMWL